MKKTSIPLLLCLCLLTGCGGQEDQGDSNMTPNSYLPITPEEAKSIMDKQEDYTLLDVRTQEEFDEGHIEGAILIPDNEIEARAEVELSDKEATLLVYCRSGHRSKLAAQALVDLGYTRVYEFGGIIDWPYDIVD